MGMELHAKCCLAEEEINLTPHHTPSQSFDFIVWEKAYLDSISADNSSSAGTSTNPTTTTTNTSTCKGILTQSYNAQSGPNSCTPLDPSTRNDSDHSKRSCLQTSPSFSALSACKTDADLPSCFLDHKLRLSGGESAAPSYHCSCARCSWTKFERLSSLEEAVCRSLAEGCTNLQQGSMQCTWDYGAAPHHRHSVACNHTHVKYHKHMTTDHGPANKCEGRDHAEEDSSSTSCTVSEALHLRRSMSQTAGVHRSAIKHGFLTEANERASETAHHHEFQKRSSSQLKPGGCKHTATHPTADDDHLNADARPLWNDAKISCFPTGLSPGRQRRHVKMPYSLGPSIDIDPSHASAGSPPLLPRPPPPLRAHSIGSHYTHADWSRSFSENSSPYDADCHVQNAVMSKLKWGSFINHKLRALWRKFCSSCPQYAL